MTVAADPEGALEAITPDAEAGSAAVVAGAVVDEPIMLLL